LSHLFDEVFHWGSSSVGSRILVVLVMAVGANILIKLIGVASEALVGLAQRERKRGWLPWHGHKVITVVRLVADSLVWGVYFVALGLVLSEAGVNSQGLVQDLVIGLTLIFSDALDVDDMVEIVGTATVVGRVQGIGLRFIKVVNLYDQIVFIPNRTVANVSRFPHGGIFAYVDVTVPANAEVAAVTATIHRLAKATWEQFEGVILMEPAIEDGRVSVEGASGNFIRMIWPGQGALIETSFRSRVVAELKALDPAYADWCVPIFYRVQKHSRPVKTSGPLA
jgi:small conductance mechanosensitive channel